MPRAPREQAHFGPETGQVGWAEPDMAVLRLHRRRPPALPATVFGPEWKSWIEDAAESAANGWARAAGSTLAPRRRHDRACRYASRDGGPERAVDRPR